jgi:hypothetical protein
MLAHVVNFYKNIFGKEPGSGVKLRDDFWEVDELITAVENEALHAPFSEDEVRTVVFSSYAEGAPGPDGLPFLFYQTFWETIKGDFMNSVYLFEKGDLNLNRLNYAMITLIPKELDARTLKKFRPISLLNCSFKIFGKMLNNRLIAVADRLITSNQTTFIKGRYILESVVAAHEIIHEVHRVKSQGLFSNWIMKKPMIELVRVS